MAEIVSSSSSSSSSSGSSSSYGNQKEKVKRQKRKNRRTKDLCIPQFPDGNGEPSSRQSRVSFRPFRPLRSANIVDEEREYRKYKEYRGKIACELARLKMQGSLRGWKWFEKVVAAWIKELDGGFMCADLFLHSSDVEKIKILKYLVNKHADRLK